MAIRKAHPNFIQAVDEEQNARDLSAAAKEAGVVADVVIDVAVGTRSGIPAGDGALALAQLVDRLPNLKLRGMLSYDGGVQHAKGFAARKAKALEDIEPNVETFEAMKKSGLNMEIFSGGGTGTYNIMHHVPGFTDVQVGSYLFMDMQYLAIGGESGDAVYTDFAPVAHRGHHRAEQPVPRPADDRRRRQGADAQHSDGRRHRRARHGLQRRLRRVRRHPVHEAAVEGIQDRRPARADRAALRSGGERIRSDVRDPQGQGRGRLADYRPREIAIDSTSDE